MPYSIKSEDDVTLGFSNHIRAWWVIVRFNWNLLFSQYTTVRTVSGHCSLETERQFQIRLQSMGSCFNTKLQYHLVQHGLRNTLIPVCHLIPLQIPVSALFSGSPGEQRINAFEDYGKDTMKDTLRSCYNFPKKKLHFNQKYRTNNKG